MSKAIYDALVAGGLSPVGACAVMGNMWAESTLKANIVEKRCTMSDEDYTKAVDTGAISVDQFIKDSYGYGLCQWTYWTRKQALLVFAKSKGVSIGDAAMQCEFCISELKADYPDLYKTLCSIGDLYTDTVLFCKDYERPAVNNIKPRFEAANKYYEEYAMLPGVTTSASTVPTSTATQTEQQSSLLDGILGLFGYKKDVKAKYVCDTKTWVALAKRMPTIKKGDNSDAVKALQCMLNVCGGHLDADGDWGDDTELTFEKYKGGAL